MSSARWGDFHWAIGAADDNRPLTGTTVSWSDEKPDTVDKYYNRKYWERDRGGTYEGDASDNDADGTLTTLPQTAPGGSVVTETIDSERTLIYSMEVRNANNILVNTFTQWFKGKLKLEVDKAEVLTFSVIGTDSIVSDLVRTNRIWVRDRWGFLVGSYIIQKTKKRRVRASDAIFVDVVAKSAIVQMAREPILSYSTPKVITSMRDLDIVTPEGFDWPRVWVPTAYSVWTILQELFADQNQIPAIKIGHISPQIAQYETEFTAEDTTLLAAVKSLQNLLPKAIAGTFYVDANSRFNWRTRIGRWGETIEVGKGLQGIESETSFEDMATRLFMYGDGADHNSRVKLTDRGANQDNEYIDSDTVGTYGIITHLKTDNRIKYPATLLRVAQRVLEEIDEPVVTVSIDAIDLAKADTAGFDDINDLYVGSKYTVSDSSQGISVLVTVVSITHDLTNPLPVKITLKNRRTDISDIIERIIESMNPPVDVNDDGTLYPTIPRIVYGDETDPTSSRYLPNMEFKDGDWKYGPEESCHRG